MSFWDGVGGECFKPPSDKAQSIVHQFRVE